jgi:hypothetical protein
MPLLPNQQAPQWYFRPGDRHGHLRYHVVLRRDQGIAELHLLSLQYSLIVPLY